MQRLDHVPHPARAQLGQGAARPPQAPGLRGVQARKQRAESGVELGHHEAARAGEVEELLSLHHPRPVLEVRSRVDARRARDESTEQGAHREDV